MREGRSRARNLLPVGQACSRRVALSRILRVSPRPRGADRARSSASRRASHHLADAVRPASQPGATSGLDGQGRPVSLRSLGRAQDPTADAKPRPREGARGRAAAQEFQPRLRVLGLLGGRCATGCPERSGRRQARGCGVDEDAAHIGATRRRHMARRFAKRERREHSAGDRKDSRQRCGPLGRGRSASGGPQRRESRPARQGQPYCHA